jgi:hypothetical protein
MERYRQGIYVEEPSDPKDRLLAISGIVSALGDIYKDSNILLDSGLMISRLHCYGKLHLLSIRGLTTTERLHGLGLR